MIHEVKHPLIEHKLTYLRDKNTDKKKFRELINEISILLFYEATRKMPMREIKIETPLEKTRSCVLQENAIAIVPILRAGLGMADALQDLIPIAKVGHIGMYRNEKTFKPEHYYMKLPLDVSERNLFLLDPMLATGNSLSAAIDTAKKKNPVSITSINVIAAPQGVEKIHKTHPDIELFTAKIDAGLDENKYIRPGLGDAGDRLFGTI